jgi:hypothetical protein
MLPACEDRSAEGWEEDEASEPNRVNAVHIIHLLLRDSLLIGIIHEFVSIAYTKR